jgi:hypothetical protein
LFCVGSSRKREKMHRDRDDQREYMGDVYGKPEKKSAVLVNWVADPEPNNPESELWIPRWD